MPSPSDLQPAPSSTWLREETTATSAAPGAPTPPSPPIPLEPSTRAAPDAEDLAPDLTLDPAVVVLAGTVVGAAIAVVILPTLLPDLAASLFGDQPKVFWYLSRSSGVVAYLALWLSAVLGLTLTNRLARLWAGGPAVADVHQFVSLLSLALVVFHVVILLGDRYASYRVDQLLVPFTATPHEPFWVGLGQVALYLAVPVTFTFYFRWLIGVRAWRLIHYLSFAVLVLAVAHGLGAGTDSGSAVMLGMYLATGCSIVFLTSYRVLTAPSRRVGVRARAPR